MTIRLKDYQISFEHGGVSVYRNGRQLYFNARPVYVSVKTYGAINEFRDIAYDTLSGEDGAVTGEAVFVTRNGSGIAVRDTYSVQDGTLKIDRTARVLYCSRDDLGFQTKVSFYQAASDELRDYDYFSPGQWYQDNRFAADFAPGKNMDLQYYWRKETWSGLPMFAMRHKGSGETVALSRWAADATLPSLDRTATENYAYVDERMTVGSFGVSKARPETLTYTYYGHMMVTPLPDTECDGVSIDYIYPAVNGQQSYRNWGPFSTGQPLSNITWVHPMREGFSQHYSVAVTFGCYDGFGAMLRATCRRRRMIPCRAAQRQMKSAVFRRPRFIMPDQRSGSSCRFRAIYGLVNSFSPVTSRITSMPSGKRTSSPALYSSTSSSARSSHWG